VKDNPEKEKVIRIFRKDFWKNERGKENKRVKIAKKPLPNGTTVKNWTGEVRRTTAREWLIFVDDDPGANWEHRCRYVFISPKEKRLVVLEGTSPPLGLELEGLPL